MVVTFVAVLAAILLKSPRVINFALKWTLTGVVIGLIHKAIAIGVNRMSWSEALTDKTIMVILPSSALMAGILGIFYWAMRSKGR